MPKIIAISKKDFTTYQFNTFTKILFEDGKYKIRNNDAQIADLKYDEYIIEIIWG